MNSILPQTRPQATPEKVREALKTALEDLPGMGKVYLEAVLRDCPVMVFADRAYYRHTMGAPDANDFGIYDDSAWIVTPNQVIAFNWNVDPSRAGWNPSLGKPYANLETGLWPFVKGQHKGLGPAWRQPYDEQARELGLDRYFIDDRKQGEFKVERSVPERNICFEDEGYHAINIHWGGENGTSSWGCQTCPPDQWLEFQSLTYKLTALAGQKWLPYVLAEMSMG